MNTTSKEAPLPFDFHTGDFTKDEQKFLDRWLLSYIELGEGRPPKRKIEEHILDMLEGRLPIDTIGMETYIKWQSAKARYERQTDGTFTDFKLTLKTVRNQFTDLKTRATADAAVLLSVMLSTDLYKPIISWTERAFAGAKTIYDVKIDAEYIMTHVGGPLHRLFYDHTIGDMWVAVKEASPDDTLAQEVAGFVDSFLKDVSTINGLPFFNISPDTYDALASSLNKGLGIPRSWTSDVLSYDFVEIFGTSLGVISLAMNWNKADREQFADYAISLGIAAGFSANPLLGIVALAGLAKALQGIAGRPVYQQELVRHTPAMRHICHTSCYHSL